MSAPTAEERAAEEAAQSRFLDVILEALTSLPGDDPTVLSILPRLQAFHVRDDALGELRA